MDTEERYEYRPKFRYPVMIIVSGCLLAYFAYDAASTNIEELVLFGVLKLSPSQATYLYWGFFVMLLYVIGFGAIALVRSVLPPRYLVLRTNEIESPKGLSYHGIAVVKYRDILDLSIKKAANHSVLQIKHKNGKFNIPEMALKDSNTFSIIHDKLLSCTSKRDLHEKAARELRMNWDIVGAYAEAIKLRTLIPALLKPKGLVGFIVAWVVVTVLGTGLGAVAGAVDAYFIAEEVKTYLVTINGSDAKFRSPPSEEELALIAKQLRVLSPKSEPVIGEVRAAEVCWKNRIRRQRRCDSRTDIIYGWRGIFFIATMVGYPVVGLAVATLLFLFGKDGRRLW